MSFSKHIHSKANILFEDENFLVLDKPAGVLSHPNPEDGQTKTSIIMAGYDFNGEFYKLENSRLYLLHRIDKETSGCLLFSKNVSHAKKVKIDFENHNIHKEYIALVGGILRQDVVWKDHLSKKNGRMVVDKREKPNSSTEINPIRIFEKERLTLLRLIPRSGRMHQLRVQSSKRFLPILGDRQHGDFAKNKSVKKTIDLKRMFLHASKLEFTDPTSKKKIIVESPLPTELKNVLEKMS
jgi:RluA family pseudouridine synthase